MRAELFFVLENTEDEQLNEKNFCHTVNTYPLRIAVLGDPVVVNATISAIRAEMKKYKGWVER